jgi:hypothetical protein
MFLQVFFDAAAWPLRAGTSRLRTAAICGLRTLARRWAMARTFERARWRDKEAVFAAAKMQ